MTLHECKKNFSGQLTKATLCFLFEDNRVCLAMKKRGFGIGKWNGTGGKVESNEIIEDAAIRETMEEINVVPQNLSKTACLDFYFPLEPNWSQRVFVFKTYQWEGVPKETEEMRPKWFKLKNLPYEKMWKDDEYWLPYVLEGKPVYAEFVFLDNEVISDSKVTLLSEYSDLHMLFV